VDDDGWIHYKCLTENDQWISPHIPELVNELDCHIYVDVVFTVSVFTYLYKYLYKGPDQTSFHVSHADDEGGTDEIAEYVNAQYLCSPESAWRIIGFDITSKRPSVDCSPVVTFPDLVATVVHKTIGPPHLLSSVTSIGPISLNSLN
jgi:hypothetical protein